MEYTRGPIIEWYQNGPEGLQQGFIVKEPISGNGVLRMEVAMEAVKTERSGPDEVSLADENGRVLMSYSKLVAWDATGRTLPSHMEVTSNGVALVVAAQDASYPVTIDPVFSTWLQQIGPEVLGDGSADDHFGTAVAISGTTAVVGAPDDDTVAGTDAGSVYIFAKTADVGWLRQATLRPTDAAAGDRFGAAVAVSGATVAAGAPGDDRGALMNAGSAYVFTRDAVTGAWNSFQKLLNTDAAAGDTFGSSVSIAGELVLIGSPLDDTGAGAGTDAGSAYVFTRTLGTWGQSAKLVASDGAASDAFGSAVALSLTTAVVGAPKDASSSGCAYVFMLGTGSWVQQGKLTSDDLATGDTLGSSVAISGETAILGAPGDDNSYGMDAGAAYVFFRSQGTWSQQKKLTRLGQKPGDGLGTSVGIWKDVAVVGSPGVDGGSLQQQMGGASFYRRSKAGWDGGASVISQVYAGARFGSSVAIDGEFSIIGSPGSESQAGHEAGQANIYAFRKENGEWRSIDYLSAGYTSLGGESGTSIGVSGNHAIVGSPNDETASGLSAGRVFLLTKQNGTWTLTSGLRGNPGVAEDRLGTSVAIDGTLAVYGVPGADRQGVSNSGTAYSVSLLKSGNWSQPVQIISTTALMNASLGNSIAISGKTVLVGAPLEQVIQKSSAGSVYVFGWSAKSSGWTEQAKLIASDVAAADTFGWAVALRKGVALVGSPGADTAGANAGAAYVFVRTGKGWIEQNKLVASNAAAGDQFGNSLALSGTTALIGAPFDDTSAGTNAGSAYFFDQSNSGWTQRAQVFASDAAASDQFGYSVAVMERIALIGAASKNTAAGSAYVFLQDAKTKAWAQDSKLSIEDWSANDRFGFAVALSPGTAMVSSAYDDTEFGNNTGTIHVFVP
ncbi:MAG: FG-GAP repeat protein [Terrimicrobiaceae bacterium]|nr:FG-GAP repeat protein [Terrimicrobiaceae bacterium]